MAITLTVAYPTGDGVTFDMDYYTGNHMPLVGQHFGPHISGPPSLSKGLGGGGPGTPAPFHVIATMTFAAPDNLDAAMAGAGPVLADIPNYYNGEPTIMVGETMG